MSLDYCLLLEGVGLDQCLRALRQGLEELRPRSEPAAAAGVQVLAGAGLVVCLWTTRGDDASTVAAQHGLPPSLVAWLTQDKTAFWAQVQLILARVVGRFVALARGGTLFYNTQGRRFELLKSDGIVRVRRDPDRVWTPAMLRELGLPYVEEELPLL